MIRLEEDDENMDFYAMVEEYDTAKDSELRDANPDLWAAIHGAEMVMCIPFDEFKKSESMQYLVYSYVKCVARAVTGLFNPDGTIKSAPVPSHGVPYLRPITPELLLHHGFVEFARGYVLFVDRGQHKNMDAIVIWWEGDDMRLKLECDGMGDGVTFSHFQTPKTWGGLVDLCRVLNMPIKEKQ